VSRIRVNIERPVLGWKFIVALGEAWFNFWNQHDQLWRPDYEGPTTIERHTIISPKTMLDVVWNPHEFHLVNVLPNGRRGQANIILIIFSPNLLSYGTEDRRRLAVHADKPRRTSQKGSSKFWAITT
jgi:hypothetical protein